MGLADEINYELDRAVRGATELLEHMAEPGRELTLEERLNIVIEAQRALVRAVLRIAEELDALRDSL
jgi:hypothetical protein